MPNHHRLARATGLRVVHPDATQGAAVDKVVESGLLKRVLAQTEIQSSTFGLFSKDGLGIVQSSICKPIDCFDYVGVRAAAAEMFCQSL